VKTLSLALLLMAGMAFVLLGCSDNSNSVVTPNDQVASSGSATSLAKIGEDLHSVTGTAHTYNIVVPELGAFIPGPKEKGGVYNTLIVNAIEHSDHSVSGKLVSQMHGIPPEGQWGWGTKVEGRIIRVAIQGNRALVVFQHTLFVGPDGTNMVTPETPWWGAMAFIDKGEGKNSPRDAAAAWWSSPMEADLTLWLSQSPQEYVDWTLLQLGDVLDPWYPDFNGWFPIDNGNIQVR
jgi:hypothetical protein